MRDRDRRGGRYNPPPKILKKIVDLAALWAGGALDGSPGSLISYIYRDPGGGLGDGFVRGFLAKTGVPGVFQGVPTSVYFL